MPAATPQIATRDRAPRSLAQQTRGAEGRICCEGLSTDDAALLRAMGLRESARVRVCRVGEPCIVEVMGSCGDGCRIGLAGPLAKRVTLRSSEAEPV